MRPMARGGAALRLALAAALAAPTARAQHARPPANWVHASPGCILGSNLVLHTGIATIEECLQLCLNEPACVAAEFWVNHGGPRGATAAYGPGACNTQSGGPANDPTEGLRTSWDSCNAALFNLDLWILCERPGNRAFLNAKQHHACGGLPGMEYGGGHTGADGQLCARAPVLAVVADAGGQTVPGFTGVVEVSEFSLKMMSFALKTMDFVSKPMDFVSKMMIVLQT